jgi:uncharacterized protein (TIGR00106 family)
VDKGESLSAYVSPVVELVRESGFPYRLTAMGTIVETEQVADALAFIERAHTLLDEAGCQRIYAAITLDIRMGMSGRLTEKIEAVKSRIGDVAS